MKISTLYFLLGIGILAANVVASPINFPADQFKGLNETLAIEDGTLLRRTGHDKHPKVDECSSRLSAIPEEGQGDKSSTHPGTSSENDASSTHTVFEEDETGKNFKDRVSTKEPVTVVWEEDVARGQTNVKKMSGSSREIKQKEMMGKEIDQYLQRTLEDKAALNEALDILPRKLSG